jgi:hypothetical protein
VASFEFCSVLSDFPTLVKECKDLENNEIFSIPIDLSCFDNFIQIEEENIELKMNEEQKKMILRFQEYS